MITSLCRTVAGFAASVSVLAFIFAVRIWRRMPSRFDFNPLRQLYVSNLWTLLLVVALSVIVAIGMLKLGKLIEDESAYNGYNFSKMEKEIKSLRQQIEDQRTVETQ